MQFSWKFVTYFVDSVIQSLLLSMNVIIIAALCLIVLIVLLSIFYSQTGRVGDSLNDIGKDASDKAKDAQNNLDKLFGCDPACDEGYSCKDGECVKDE